MFTTGMLKITNKKCAKIGHNNKTENRRVNRTQGNLDFRKLLQKNKVSYRYLFLVVDFIRQKCKFA